MLYRYANMSKLIQFIDTVQSAVLPDSAVIRGSQSLFGSSSLNGLSTLDWSTVADGHKHFVTATGQEFYNLISVKPFAIYRQEFVKLLGNNPRLNIIAKTPEKPFAHEAGAWIESTREVYFTSNGFKINDKKIMEFSKIEIPKQSPDNDPNDIGILEYNYEQIHPSSDIPSGNGGIDYELNGIKGVLFCSQGSWNIPGSLMFMEAKHPYKTTRLLNNYHGRPFNSPNDVIVHPNDGSIWFTDPDYAYCGKNREKKLLPNQVYCYNPVNGDIRVVANGFVKPNGLCFSPDAKYVYITDTAIYSGITVASSDNQATVYRYNVICENPQADYPVYTLENRKVFAYADCGAPDGIKCDRSGYVYGACKDGLNVWNPDGVLIGKVVIPGSISNFCFAGPGRLILFNQYRIFEAILAQ